MGYAGGLLAFSGIVSFLGFAMVGVGMSQPIPIVGGFAFFSPTVAQGIVFIGLGVLLGALGAAMKGPSREWSEIAPNPPGPRPLDFPMRKCPNCGVHSYLKVCPECGHKLAALPTQ
jgi:hypothetical protein